MSTDRIPTSRTRSMSERKTLDQYYTPQPVADALVSWYLKRFPSDRRRRVLEPSFGRGAFVRALRARLPVTALHITGVDLDPAEMASCNDTHIGDFLQFRSEQCFDLAIGNPPFSDAEAHIRHAMGMVAPNGGHVAFLLRLAFMESAKRARFWSETRAREIVVLQQRPSFTGGGTDSAAYGFFVFERGYQGSTVVHPCWSGDTK